MLVLDRGNFTVDCFGLNLDAAWPLNAVYGEPSTLDTVVPSIPEHSSIRCGDQLWTQAASQLVLFEKDLADP